MSYDSYYSDNCNNDSCHSDDDHSVDSYGTTSFSDGSYNGALAENYCPCQPVQIKIFKPENMYIDKGSYDGEIEDYNSDDASISHDHNRSNRQDNGDADADHDDKSHTGDSRDQIKDKNRKEEMNENSKDDAEDEISPKYNMITSFCSTPIVMPAPKIGIKHLLTRQSNRVRTNKSNETRTFRRTLLKSEHIPTPSFQTLVVQHTFDFKACGTLIVPAELRRKYKDSLEQKNLFSLRNRNDKYFQMWKNIRREKAYGNTNVRMNDYRYTEVKFHECTSQRDHDRCIREIKRQDNNKIHENENDLADGIVKRRYYLYLQCIILPALVAYIKEGFAKAQEKELNKQKHYCLFKSVILPASVAHVEDKSTKASAFDTHADVFFRHL